MTRCWIRSAFMNLLKFQSVQKLPTINLINSNFLPNHSSNSHPNSNCLQSPCNPSKSNPNSHSSSLSNLYLHSIHRKTSLQRSNFRTLWISSLKDTEEQLSKSRDTTDALFSNAVRLMGLREAWISTSSLSIQAHSKSVQKRSKEKRLQRTHKVPRKLWMRRNQLETFKLQKTTATKARIAWQKRLSKKKISRWKMFSNDR